MYPGIQNIHLPVGRAPLEVVLQGDEEMELRFSTVAFCHFVGHHLLDLFICLSKSIKLALVQS